MDSNNGKLFTRINTYILDIVFLHERYKQTIAKTLYFFNLLPYFELELYHQITCFSIANLFIGFEPVHCCVSVLYVNLVIKNNCSIIDIIFEKQIKNYSFN